MILPRRFVLALLGLFAIFAVVWAEDEENEDAAEAAGDDDADADADGDDGGGYDYENYEGDDYIKYWTGYAVYPKKCITYEGVDMIVFNVFENGFKQCSDTPMGTYIAPVPIFVQAYLDQMEANELDMGNDDYQQPEASQYAQCAQYNGDNGQYSVMIGCSDEDTHLLAANIYSDAACDERDYENGADDSNIDVTDLQLPFHSCQACVTWLDKNDDEVDDQYYENKQINAPLCSQIWARKEECDKTCQKMGREYEDSQHWSQSDTILLGLLGAFAALMMFGAIRKRRQMQAREDSLLASEVPVKPTEQPRFSDNQLLIAFAVCAALVIVFALLVIKGVTWALLLGLNLVLFGYLLKLVMDSGTACGSLGDEDSDDEEEEEPHTTDAPMHELT